ncbi:MAG: hypothetical protein GY754_03785 [bacterium]|nr:hypothetical protein [bacterium]
MGFDCLLAKYNSAGNIQWLQHWGTGEVDNAMSVSTDSAGGVIISGYYGADIEGYTNQGGRDIFLSRYDSFGDAQ